MKDLGSTVKRGVGWIALARAANFFIRLGASISLARLLDPQDFGAFGMTLIFTGFASYFANLGFGMAYIQRREVSREHLAALFVLNAGLFFVVGSALVLSSPLVGRLFHSDIVASTQAVLALELFLQPFLKPPLAVLRRRMDFRAVAGSEVVNWLGGSAATVSLAILGWGVWSLVVGRLAGGSLSCVYCAVTARWLPSVRTTRAAMGDLFAFGMKLLAKNLLYYSSEKVDYFFAGRRLGESALGFYEKSFATMDIFVRELSVKLCEVLFPAFAKIQDDRTRLAGAYKKVVLATAVVSAPLFTGLVVVAEPVTLLLYGEKWLPSVLPLQVLCAAGWLRLQIQLASTMVNAMGHVGAEVKIRLVSFVVLAAACWLGTDWGILGVSVAVLVVTAGLAVAILKLLGTLASLSWHAILGWQIPAIGASSVMLVVLLLTQGPIARLLSGAPIVALGATVALGAVVYIAALWTLRTRDLDALLRELAKDLYRAVRGIRGRLRRRRTVST